MPKCFCCGEEIGNLPFKCRYCNNFYCNTHRLPENHDCTGDLKSSPRIKPKPKPIKFYKFQEESEKQYVSEYIPYSKSEQNMNTKYCSFGIIIIVLIFVFAYLFSLDLMGSWLKIIGHLCTTLIVFGITILLPLLFTKPKNQSKLSRRGPIKKGVSRLIFWSELLILMLGLYFAGYYWYTGMGNFITIFWTFFGLSNLFLLSIFLEIKARLDPKNKLEATVKKLTKFASLIIFLNILILLILGLLVSFSVLSSIVLDSFLEFYWIYYSLFTGFYLGQIVTRW